MDAGALEKFRGGAALRRVQCARCDGAAIEFGESLHAGTRDNVYLLIEQARDESELALQVGARSRRASSSVSDCRMATSAPSVSLNCAIETGPVFASVSRLAAFINSDEFLRAARDGRLRLAAENGELVAYLRGGRWAPRLPRPALRRLSSRVISFFAAAAPRSFRPGFGARLTGGGALFRAGHAVRARLARFGGRLFGGRGAPRACARGRSRTGCRAAPSPRARPSSRPARARRSATGGGGMYCACAPPMAQG